MSQQNQSKIALTPAAKNTSPKNNNSEKHFKNFKLHKHVSEISSLPFVRPNKDKSELNWFDVPATGNYIIDCNTGSDCALMLIKAMRDDHEDAVSPGHLQCIVLSLMNLSESQDELRGVIVGFFSTLDSYLRWAAKQGGKNLDDVTYDQLIERVVTGLKEAE